MEKDGILITGGTGFLGSHLVPLLRSKGRVVKILSRKGNPAQQTYQWSIENKSINQSVFSDIGSIIHLAGAGIADRSWTISNKNEIVTSRVRSAELLFQCLQSVPNSVHTFISASATGYYGDTGEDWAKEDFQATKNFLGQTCIMWENAARQFESLGIRVVIFRIGFVLANDGGALPVIARPVRLFCGSPIGNGNQYISWIHIEDLCRMFSFALDNKNIHGIFNAVAPGPVTNKSFINQIGVALKRFVWPFSIPSPFIRIVLGEKSVLVLDSQRISSEKIRKAGFNFIHTDLQKSISGLLRK